MATLPSDAETQADAAISRGDAAGAERFLAQAARTTPGRLEAWMKLAATRRGLGNIPGALEAISGALRIDPLNFSALLARATFLDQLHSPGAGEAYGRALAQRPEKGGTPAHLTTAIARAERRYSEYQLDVFNRLRRLVPASTNSEGEMRRIQRFCTNIARTTQPYHSEPTHFHYPGLSEQEFHDPEQFPWLAALEAATHEIRSEFEAAMTAERAELVPYIQYADDVPLRQWKRLNHSPDWTAIHLIQNGVRIEANARHCPKTLALLEQFEQPHISGCSPNAMFSLLAPHTHIPPHTGVANTRLVCHLPLILPGSCWFRVGADRRAWEMGKAWVFDDTIEHEAMNESDQLRVLLIFDTWHPGLSPAEREAVAAIMAASSTGAIENGL